MYQYQYDTVKGFYRYDVKIRGYEQAVIEVRVENFFGERANVLPHKHFLIYNVLDSNGKVINGITVYDLLGRRKDLPIFRREALNSLGIFIPNSNNVHFNLISEEEVPMIRNAINEAMEAELNILDRIVADSQKAYMQNLIALGAAFVNPVWSLKRKAAGTALTNTSLFV